MGVRKSKIPLSFTTKRIKEVTLEEITEEEIHEGATIASALNFKSLGLSASISQAGGEHFGPVKDLSPLGDMVSKINLIHALDITNRSHIDFSIFRMALWIFLLIMLMEIVCGSLYLQNLVPTNQFQQR